MSTRRRFSPEFKATVVLELIGGIKTPAEVSRGYQLKPPLRSRWKTAVVEQAALLFQSDEQRRQEHARIAELERLVGRLTLELEGAKKASTLLNGNLGRSERWSGSWQQSIQKVSSHPGLPRVGLPAQQLLLAAAGASRPSPETDD